MMSAHQSLLSYRRPSNVPPQSMEAIIYDWLFGAGDEKETAFAQSPPPPHKQPQFGRARKMPISTPSPPAPPISPLSASFSTSSFMPGLCDAPLSPTLHSLPRSYATLERRSVPLATFGGEGTRDGLLSRPWGICCDSHGRILVADRSNNRVQIFSPDGEFLSKFGTYGSYPGQMNRPAGLCTNTLNQIIVADKDNHRIQVFSETGVFSFLFGSPGRGPGQFNYPWGVASSSTNDIAVSDTRNHRVQIFNMYGQFLRKCTFDAGLVGKNLYSPRGLVYLPDGCLVVTDFNGHRVAVLDMSKLVIDVAFYGAEGHQPGMFCRPQGVALDNAGNILVCDSRCNRVQVFNPSRMRVLSVLGADTSPTYQTATDESRSSIVGANYSTTIPPPPMLGSCNGPLTINTTQPPPPLGSLSALNSLAMSLASPPPSSISTGSSSGGSTSSAASSSGASSSHQLTARCSLSGSGTESGNEAVFCMDRPSDVCVGLDGRVYVVDFGNHCVHIF